MSEKIFTSNFCKENCNNVTKAFEMACSSKSESYLFLIHEGDDLSVISDNLETTISFISDCL